MPRILSFCIKGFAAWNLARNPGYPLVVGCWETRGDLGAIAKKEYYGLP